MEEAHVLCTVCGTRWTLSAPSFWSIQQPRYCKTEGCDAQWLDLPMFKDRVDADRAAAQRETEREVV